MPTASYRPDVIECLRTRRSVRNFNDKPVAEETIRELINHVQASAPSAVNMQAWAFYVLKNDYGKKRDHIAHFTSEEGIPHHALLRAPFSILICGAPDRQHPTPGLEEVTEHSWEIDAASAATTAGFVAHAMGLGSVWQDVRSHFDEIKSWFAVENAYHIPFCILSVGYSDQEMQKMENRDGATVKFV